MLTANGGMFRENLGSHRVVKHNVVALMGAKGSGKDSFYERWTSRPIYPTVNLKFAEKLNIMLNEIIGSEVAYEDRDTPITVKVEIIKAVLDKHMFKGASDIWRIHGEVIETTWRKLAEWFGTDIVRGIDPDFFTNYTKQEIEECIEDDYLVMLSDVRFDNEMKCATLGIGFKRDEDTRLEFDPKTPAPEKLGELITVYSNRYLVLRDLSRESEADYMLMKLESYLKERGLELHNVYQTVKDADGHLNFVPIQEAYNHNKEVSNAEINDWFE